MEQNKQLLKDIIKPINLQIEEIKQIYEQSKKTHKQIDQQMDQNSNPM